jgi:hypothetical protein
MVWVLQIVLEYKKLGYKCGGISNYASGPQLQSVMLTDEAGLEHSPTAQQHRGSHLEEPGSLISPVGNCYVGYAAPVRTGNKGSELLLLILSSGEVGPMCNGSVVSRRGLQT